MIPASICQLMKPVLTSELADAMPSPLPTAVPLLTIAVARLLRRTGTRVLVIV